MNEYVDWQPDKFAKETRLLTIFRLKLYYKNCECYSKW